MLSTFHKIIQSNSSFHNFLSRTILILLQNTEFRKICCQYEDDFDWFDLIGSYVYQLFFFQNRTLIRSVVPQGSLFDPLLFILILVNQLSAFLNCEVIMFADYAL